MKKSYTIAIIITCFLGIYMSIALLVYSFYKLNFFAIPIIKYKYSQFDNVKILEYKWSGDDCIVGKILVTNGAKSVLLEMTELQQFDKFYITSVNGKSLIGKLNDLNSGMRYINNNNRIWDISSTDRLCFKEHSVYNDLLKLNITTLEDLINNAFVIDSFLNSLPEYPKETTPRYYTNDSTFEIYYVMTKQKYSDTAYTHFDNDTTLKFKFHSDPYVFK